MKLIKLDELVSAVENMKAMYGNDNSSLVDQGAVLDLIAEQPIIEAEPVIHACWIKEPYEPYKCSECGRYEVDDSELYCHCGAKMEGTVEVNSTRPIIYCKDCKCSSWEQEQCHGRIEYYCNKFNRVVSKYFSCKDREPRTELI